MMTNSREYTRREVTVLEARIVEALMDRDEQEAERVIQHASHLYPNRQWNLLTERKW